MIQTINGQNVYVIDLKTMPQLPIWGTGWEAPYAEALTAAISEGVINETGKYGVQVNLNTNEWKVFKITESVDKKRHPILKLIKWLLILPTLFIFLSISSAISSGPTTAGDNYSPYKSQNYSIPAVNNCPEKGC